MKTIVVKSLGDRWINSAEVQEILQQDDGTQQLLLDLRAEGLSLRRVGLIDMLKTHCQQTGRSQDSILIKGWSNNVESIPFKRMDSFLISHCFWMSDHYKIETRPTPWYSQMFGLCIGRRTLPRMKMLKDIRDTMPDRCFVTLMKSRMGLEWKYHEPEAGWMDPKDMPEFETWAQTLTIPSIDDHWVHEHFQSDQNTNRDLLKHYHRFHIEIVVETFTLGDCFFPTEKTVRPIVGGKPMLVYGPRHYLKRLRDLGFQTWSDYWDESYDEYEGPERWKIMFETIKSIKECPDPGIAEYNQRHLEKINQAHRPL